MKKQKGFTAPEMAGLIVILVGLLLAGGWVWNVVKIINAGFDVMNGMLIARCIGVFLAPLGGVLGFL